MDKEAIGSPEFNRGDLPDIPSAIPQESVDGRLQLPGSLNKALALTGSVLTLAAANLAREAVLTTDKVNGAALECTTTTTVSPDGTSTSTETTCSTDGSSTEATSPKPETSSPTKSQNEGKHNDRHRPRPEKGKKQTGHNNLLPVPKKRTRRHWATKILNEVRKGKQGRISASREVITDLNRTRRGKCAQVEQTGDCVKVDKTLLKVLYKASQIKKFFIWHLTDGPHVPTSFHFSKKLCRAADLRKFNRKAATDKSLFSVIRRVTPRNKSLELIGPGDDANHTGKKDGHVHMAVY